MRKGRRRPSSPGKGTEYQTFIQVGAISLPDQIASCTVKSLNRVIEIMLGVEEGMRADLNSGTSDHPGLGEEIERLAHDRGHLVQLAAALALGCEVAQETMERFAESTYRWIDEEIKAERMKPEPEAPPLPPGLARLCAEAMAAADEPPRRRNVN